MKISYFSCDLQRKIKKAISKFWQERFISLKNEDSPNGKNFLLKTPFFLPKTNPALLEKAIELADLSEQTLEQELITLSNGELRRLMLARNYMEEPDLWILDDPFGGMDQDYRKFLAERIKLFQQTGINIKINLTNNKEPDAHEWPSLNGRTDGEIVFSLKNLTVSFGSKKIIENLSWEVRKGEHWALMGPNGSGKSTLLGIVSGDHPQRYNNEVELLERGKIGFFSPEMALHAPSRISALQLLLEDCFPQPVLAEEKKFALNMLSNLGLSDKFNKPLKNLSEEYKRLALIARAICKNPRLLILDEPTQDMSSELVELLFSALDKICSKTTLVFATHYLGKWPKCINNTIFLKKD